ncbi:four-carbon acid sugar kinase family protein [Eubacterium sp. 1001713B170207_170306_E7]|uniref:four-carbon acid sugar kinase family protein n=1 Tax=Eubacterium sp. 1001713B170207_170306_E7 TaxID=2787097 RepID=UPI00189C1609|nr:four-carbon acid sugar kinase family protein [Eubacterium sp. 1001713B170207_170306_E7]
MIRLVVLADDFTGALDTGIQFGKLGISTVVTQQTGGGRGIDSDCEVLVINTESRHLTGGQAGQKLYEVSRGLKRAGVSFLYKKIDSTLRGNIGAELYGCMKGMQEEQVMLVPAYPENKRYTRGGQQYIGETPLSETTFARDPFNPVISSKISEIIHSQCAVPVYDVPASELERFAPVQTGIYLFDAESQQDMERIAGRLKKLNSPGILSGCAGFASFLPGLLGMKAQTQNIPGIQRPLLLMCGSVCPVSADQLKKARATGIPVFKLSDYLELSGKDNQGLDRLLRELAGQAGHTVILSSSDIEKPCPFSPARGADRACVADRLGYITRCVAEALGYKDIAVFGGDTLLAVLNHLGLTDLRPVDEIEPGVVLSETGGYRVISKAGGLGREDVVERMLAYTGAIL